ncbi:MAG TPA: hypothetical protein VGF57_00850 [Roseiarcus sp.]|jgi:hypothetical protein
MAALVDRPGLMLVVSFVVFLLAAMLGVVAHKARNSVKASDHNELAIVQSAALTLLGLIVGFSFAMAISRYDQRKGLEEAEANAIGTEYLRAGLMPDDAAANARSALKQYLDLRIQYYITSDRGELARIGGERARLEADLWAAARSLSQASPTPIMALVASGLNDVFNAADATAAGWLDRIPVPAWWLLVMIGVAANVMLGFGARRFDPMLIVIPLTVSVSLFLIADIDSPRGGVVQVPPLNLTRLANSLGAP